MHASSISESVFERGSNILRAIALPAPVLSGASHARTCNREVVASGLRIQSFLNGLEEEASTPSPKEGAQIVEGKPPSFSSKEFAGHREVKPRSFRLQIRNLVPLSPGNIRINVLQKLDRFVEAGDTM
jgi:hypothetical protein